MELIEIKQSIKQKPYYETDNGILYCEDCVEIIKQMPDNSIDAVVTDPPAGISFMGEEWDTFDKTVFGIKGMEGKNDLKVKKNFEILPRYKNYDLLAFQDFICNVFLEVKRVLKPGGHALIWAIPRTSHHTALGVERAGFEIRDCIYHVFGSGFPKSLNIGKKLQQWEGWGTALKPAVECWWLARKPLSEKTVVENVLKWGVGGLNIDGCRIDLKNENLAIERNNSGFLDTRNKKWGFKRVSRDNKGRFPANLIHDGSEQVEFEFAKAGISKSIGGRIGNKGSRLNMSGTKYEKGNIGDIGTPSRFFYCAKVSSSERDEGLEGLNGLEVKRQGLCGEHNNPIHQNFHPTVKPITLMRYLCRLITPPNGIVLDCFAGSGSTCIGALFEGFRYIGIEKEIKYCEITMHRIKHFEQIIFSSVIYNTKRCN